MWLWRFSTERGSLWHSTILSNYEMDLNRWDCSAHSTPSISLISKQILCVFHLFVPHVRFVIGDRRSVRGPLVGRPKPFTFLP